MARASSIPKPQPQDDDKTRRDAIAERAFALCSEGLDMDAAIAKAEAEFAPQSLAPVAPVADKPQAPIDAPAPDPAPAQTDAAPEPEKPAQLIGCRVLVAKQKVAINGVLCAFEEGRVLLLGDYGRDGIEHLQRQLETEPVYADAAVRHGVH